MPFDVEAYDTYRPAYPASTLNTLAEIGAFSPGATVADVGSGTGIFSELLVRQGCRVYGVEPRHDLTLLAQRRVVSPQFTPARGSAEQTTLRDSSVDLVTAASSLHWFDTEPTRIEFARILRGQKWVVALWNFRNEQPTAFSQAFDKLWRELLGPPPAAERDQIEQTIAPAFFGINTYSRHTFANPLECNEDHLVGLVSSSSNAPPRETTEWQHIETRVRELHQAHQINGFATVPYETLMYCGRLP